jgi:hypothetical protein
MKFLIFISSLLLTFISCGTSNQKTIDKKSIDNSIKHIDKNAVSKIDLLIAGTSIIDLPAKHLSKLIDIGDGQSFVDSSGNPLCKPSQIITFKNLDKDSLINIFNSFLDSLQQNTATKICITLYTHVFLLYDYDNKINGQIDFAFDCPMQFDYLHRGITFEVKDYKSKLITAFINKLKSVNAFIPIYGPPLLPKN